MTAPLLGPFPDDWQRALAVMAHPDDMEYGGAAAVARLDPGRQAGRVPAAHQGRGGHRLDAPDERARVRVEEQLASAAIVGVDEVEFLDHPDGMLTYGLDLRRDIAAAIRRHRPEVVLATNHRETYGGRYLNMADHRVAGQATIDAVRDAANRWVFPDLATRRRARAAGRACGTWRSWPHRTPRTPSTSPTRSTSASSPCGPTPPTCAASATPTPRRSCGAGPRRWPSGSSGRLGV